MLQNSNPLFRSAQNKMAAASAESANICDDADAASDTSQQPQSAQKKPICVIVLGMAGSGKTTFVQVHAILICLLLGTLPKCTHYRSKS